MELLSPGAYGLPELTAAGFARDDIGLLAKDAEDRSPEDDTATRATVAQSNHADANLDVGTETALRGLPEARAPRCARARGATP